MGDASHSVHYFGFFLIIVSGLMFGYINEQEKSLHMFLLKAVLSIMTPFVFVVLWNHKPEDLSTDLFLIIGYLGSLVMSVFLPLIVIIETIEFFKKKSKKS